MFNFGKNRTVKFYADGLYDLDGYLMRKRRQKNRGLTDKSANIRNGLMKSQKLSRSPKNLLWNNRAGKPAFLFLKNIGKGVEKALHI